MNEGMVWQRSLPNAAHSVDLGTAPEAVRYNSPLMLAVAGESNSGPPVFWRSVLTPLHHRSQHVYTQT